MLSITYRPEICFEDMEQRCIRVSQSIMDYLIDNVDEEDCDFDDTEIFYVDINDKIIAELSALAETDEEYAFVKDIVRYNCNWINVCPHIYVG